jgi:hypothetical protein
MITLPGWEDIESAIRALDQFSLPIVSLALREETSDRLEDNIQMTVVGGNGVYMIECMPGDGQFHLVTDPTKGDEEVEVWLSDQGCQTEECNVCRDVADVLKIVRHFTESGAMDLIRITREAQRIARAESCSS